MFEEGKPWWVPTGAEVHAAGYGLFNSATKIKIPTWDEIPKLGYSPQLVQDIQEKYHYFGAGFYIPRVFIAAVIGIRFLLVTDIFNSEDTVKTAFNLLFGLSL
jgi:hypothetical protein